MFEARSNLQGFALGAAAFILVNLFVPSTDGSRVGWFLNSGKAILGTLGIVGLTAFSLELVARSFAPWRPLWFTAGATVAMIGYLFTIGPGNLFPIVIVIGAGMLVPTVFVLGYAGVLVRGLVRKD